MLYGNCISCNYNLGDGSKRTIAKVTSDKGEAHICNDSKCESDANAYGWTVLMYSGKQTINKPGHQGIFLLE